MIWNSLFLRIVHCIKYRIVKYIEKSSYFSSLKWNYGIIILDVDYNFRYYIISNDHENRVFIKMIVHSIHLSTKFRLHPYKWILIPRRLVWFL